MAKKHNHELRAPRDLNKRKKPNDSNAWAKRMLEQIQKKEAEGGEGK